MYSYGRAFPYSLAPPAPPEVPASAWSSDAFGQSQSSSHSETIITVEGPQDDPPSQGDLQSLHSESAILDMEHNEGYLMPSTPRRRYDHRFTGVRPEELSGVGLLSPVQYTYHHAAGQRRSFDSPPHTASQFRSHSDPVTSRPQLNVQSHELVGSAVDDGYSSPIEPSPTSSTPSSPAHSGHDPHSPIPPWCAGPFLAPPAIPRHRPRAPSFRGSDTSSNRSSSPNLEWDNSTLTFDLEDMSNSLYEQLITDNSLHPPMLPEAGDLRIPTHATMYRHPNTSFWDSSDASSVRSPSPNTEWDPASPFGGSHLEDSMLTNAQDEDSPKTSSSNETARAADRQGEELLDLTKRLQLQDRAGLAAGSYSSVDYFTSHPFRTSADVGAPHLGLMSSTQHPHRSITAGSGLLDAGLNSKEQISGGPTGDEHSEEGRFRPVVSTDAGRRAAAARRKDKSKPGPHVCELCGADFTAKHNWQNHMNSHNSLRNFFCRMCGRGFGTKHVMLRHEGKCNRNRRRPPPL